MSRGVKRTRTTFGFTALATKPTKRKFSSSSCKILTEICYDKKIANRRLRGEMGSVDFDSHMWPPTSQRKRDASYLSYPSRPEIFFVTRAKKSDVQEVKEGFLFRLPSANCSSGVQFFENAFELRVLSSGVGWLESWLKDADRMKHVRMYLPHTTYVNTLIVLCLRGGPNWFRGFNAQAGCIKIIFHSDLLMSTLTVERRFDRRRRPFGEKYRCSIDFHREREKTKRAWKYLNKREIASICPTFSSSHPLWNFVNIVSANSSFQRKILLLEKEKLLWCVCIFTEKKFSSRGKYQFALITAIEICLCKPRYWLFFGSFRIDDFARWNGTCTMTRESNLIRSFGLVCSINVMSDTKNVTTDRPNRCGASESTWVGRCASKSHPFRFHRHFF